MSHSSSSSSSFVTRAPGRPALERAVLDGVGAHGRDVEAGGVVHAAGDVRDADDGRAAVDELLRGDAADVAEALDDAALLGEPPPEPLAGAGDDHHDAGARRLVAEDRAADRDRLARDDLRDGVTALHRVRVHHPRHRLLVRRHVGRGNVLLRPDERQELGREATRETLDLAGRQLARVAADAALRAAVREPQQRALPRHPDGERGALAERDLGVVADPALRRPEHARVLHAVAGEHDRRPSSSFTGQATMIERSGCRSRSATPVVDVRVRHRLVELRDRGPVERRVELEVGERRDVLGARHRGVECIRGQSRRGSARRGSGSPPDCGVRCRGWESNPDVPEGQPVLSRPRLTSSATPAARPAYRCRRQP